MKLETLAKRLAEKTGTPVLEQVILGQEPVERLPDDHMIWTGAANGRSFGHRLIKRRDANNVAFPDMILDMPYGVVNWQGKRISVHRLIFQLIVKPDYEFRMTTACGVSCCVHPLHWEVSKVEPAHKETDAVPDFEFSGDDDWTSEEVEELVEIVLGEQSPETWDDVLLSPLMEGVPEDLLRACLLDLGKGHLT